MMETHMPFDLNELSLDELKKLRKDVEKAISNFEERARLQALAEAEEVARSRGFSLSELAEVRKSKGKGKMALPGKYANPADPNQTWSGRGRRPKWVVEALAAGKDLEDLKIAG